jgi:pentatricopeptide repeat protein
MHTFHTMHTIHTDHMHPQRSLLSRVPSHCAISGLQAWLRRFRCVTERGCWEVSRARAAPRCFATKRRIQNSGSAGESENAATRERPNPKEKGEKGVWVGEEELQEWEKADPVLKTLQNAKDKDSVKARSGIKLRPGQTVAEARQRIADARKRTRSGMVRELEAAVRKRQPERAERLFEEMFNRGMNPDVFVFNQLLVLYARHGNVRRAVRTYNRMKEFSVKPQERTFNILADCLARAAPHGGSEELLEKLSWIKDTEMKKFSITPSVATYNALMKAKLAVDPAKTLDGVWELTREMQSNGVRPDVATYTMWMRLAAIRRGHPAEEEQEGNETDPGGNEEIELVRAFQIWEEMKRNKVAPDLQAFNELMSLCVRSSDSVERDMTFELYGEMIAENVEPDRRTYDILLRACWDQRRFSTALRLWDEIKQRGQLSSRSKPLADAGLCTAVLKVCTRNRSTNREEVTTLISDVLEIVKRHDLPYTSELYEQLIAAYGPLVLVHSVLPLKLLSGRAGKLDKAQAMFERSVAKVSDLNLS